MHFSEKNLSDEFSKKLLLETDVEMNNKCSTYKKTVIHFLVSLIVKQVRLQSPNPNLYSVPRIIVLKVSIT